MTTSGPFDFANYKRTFRDRAAESNDSEMQAGNLERPAEPSIRIEQWTRWCDFAREQPRSEGLA